MSLSGVETGTGINITMSARRKVRLKIPLALKPVRTVSCVVATGTALRGPVARLIATSIPPATASRMLASAWSSSRSQLAAHFDFTLIFFPRERRAPARHFELCQFMSESHIFLYQTRLESLADVKGIITSAALVTIAEITGLSVPEITSLSQKVGEQ